MREATVTRNTKETCIDLTLSLDGGELSVTGRVDSISYEEQTQSSQGLFSRLFG